MAVTILAEGLKHAAVFATCSSNSSGKVTEFMKMMLASLKSTFAKLSRIKVGGLQEVAEKNSQACPSQRISSSIKSCRKTGRKGHIEHYVFAYLSKSYIMLPRQAARTIPCTTMIYNVHMQFAQEQLGTVAIFVTS